MRIKILNLGDLVLKKFYNDILGVIGISVLVVFASACISYSDTNTSFTYSNGYPNSKYRQSTLSTGNTMVKYRRN